MALQGIFCNKCEKHFPKMPFKKIYHCTENSEHHASMADDCIYCGGKMVLGGVL